MLDLYVWGPGFGLPSIDAECLAIITYLRAAAPTSSWRLVACNDPSVSPSHSLPAINHDGVWTSGYRHIIRYITSKSLCTNLDAPLSAAQRSDILAAKSFLSAHAAPLLDLSLYASAANWAAATRPAYGGLLPFPLTWTVPPLLRAEALRRVEHLGLAELDGDFDPSGRLHLAGAEALPETFRRHLPRQVTRTVRGEMTPEQAAAIRLYALTEDCLEEVDRWLGPARDGNDQKTGYMAGSEVSSLDCLAFAHLALMRDPSVPRSFLRDCMEDKTPRLSHFVDYMKASYISGKGDLPWATPEPTSVLRLAARTLDTSLCHVPSLGEYYVAEKRRRAEGRITGLDRRAVILLIGLLTTGVTAGYGLYTYRALQPFGLRTQFWRRARGGSKLGELGLAGAILSAPFGFTQMAQGAEESRTVAQ